MSEYRDYGYDSTRPIHTQAYLVPVLQRLAPTLRPGLRVLDVGCGKGDIANDFARLGCHVVGVDLSPTGIEMARKEYPKIRFEVLGADESVLQNLNEEPFDVVISTEVVEHLYSPRPFIKGCYSALRPGGRVLISTPYHGYAKNVAIALAGKMDKHYTALWDGGHIKFWSRATLGKLMTEAGLTNIQFAGAGRWPMFWKSMIMSGDRPT